MLCLQEMKHSLLKVYAKEVNKRDNTKDAYRWQKMLKDGKIIMHGQLPIEIDDKEQH